MKEAWKNNNLLKFTEEVSDDDFYRAAEYAEAHVRKALRKYCKEMEIHCHREDFDDVAGQITEDLMNEISTDNDIPVKDVDYDDFVSNYRRLINSIQIA